MPLFVTQVTKNKGENHKKAINQAEKSSSTPEKHDKMALSSSSDLIWHTLCKTLLEAGI